MKSVDDDGDNIYSPNEKKRNHWLTASLNHLTSLSVQRLVVVMGSLCNFTPDKFLPHIRVGSW